MLIYRGAVQAGRPGLHALIGGKYALRPGTAPVPPMETSINSPCGENLAEWTQSNLHLVDRSQNCRYVRARARAHAARKTRSGLSAGKSQSRERMLQDRSSCRAWPCFIISIGFPAEADLALHVTLVIFESASPTFVETRAGSRVSGLDSTLSDR